MLDLLRNVLVPGDFEPHRVHFEGIAWLMWADIAANVAIAEDVSGNGGRALPCRQDRRGAWGRNTRRE